MLKLILKEDRKELRKEYFLRLLTVCLWLIMILQTVFIAVAFASYAQVSVSKEVLRDRIANLENSEVTKDRKDFEQIAKSLNTKISAFSNAQINTSYFYDSIMNSVVDGINISSAQITLKEEKVKNKDVKIANIEIRGIAKDRESLVDFEKTLNNKDVFDTVSIPLSNFTRNENIPFVVSVSSVDLLTFFESSQNNYVINEVIKKQND